MNTDKLVALALADSMLARKASRGGLIEAANWVFDTALPWVPSLCDVLLARTGENFHDFSRHELADIILKILGRGDGDSDSYDDDDDEDEEDEGAYDVIEWVKLPPIKRYCLDLPLRPDPPDWLAWLALPDLPSVGDLARWLDASPTEIDWFADKWRVAPDQLSRLQH